MCKLRVYIFIYMRIYFKIGVSDILVELLGIFYCNNKEFVF